MPIYVWPLLGYLIWEGWKARRTCSVSWKSSFILPVILCLWSFYSFYVHYPLITLCLWGVSMMIGTWLGIFTLQGLQVRFDRNRDLIEIPGHWTPLILSLEIFALRYFVGSTYEMHPELACDPTLLVMENMAAVVSGMFLGRCFGFYLKRKKAPS